MRVVFSDRAYIAIMAETTEKIKTETGGLFLGTFINDTWYVIEAIDPGINSVFEVAYFEYDQVYTQHLIRKIANLYESELSLIGLWHRHPGSFDIFSSTDDTTNIKYARLNEQGAISALVNIDPDFRLTVYSVDKRCKYTRIKYEVGDKLIPEELFRYKSTEQFERIMKGCPTKNKNEVKDTHKSVSFKWFLNTIEPYYIKNTFDSFIAEPKADSEKVINRMLDELFDDIVFLSDDLGVEITVIPRNKYVVFAQESTEGIERLYFAYSEDKDMLVFEHNGKSFSYHSSLFKECFNKAKESLTIKNDDENLSE